MSYSQHCFLWNFLFFFFVFDEGFLSTPFQKDAVPPKVKSNYHRWKPNSTKTDLCLKFQLLGECHCWWTKESPRAHVAKFYGRLRLIRSVLSASKFSVLKLTEIVILWVYYTIPFGFSLIRHFLDITFQLLLLCLAKDHWWGFITRNAHMVHIVNLIQFKMVYTSR